MSKRVQLVEVGLRDGLQNEKSVIDIQSRAELLLKLSQAGAERIEIGAFVRADKIPQMAGSQELIKIARDSRKSKKIPAKTQFSALVPNEKGFLEALQSGIEEIAIFAGCTESFSKANINCSIDESFSRFEPVVKLAKKNKIKIRGYLSVCFGCPYEGEVKESVVVKLAQRMIALGCFEVSIGDTIGVATPKQVLSLFKKLKAKIPAKKLAGHFHDTRGTALANIQAALGLGIRVFDTSMGGLGGCPYAPGSAGNVATEDVAYMLAGMGYPTGINIDKYVEANRWFSQIIKKELPSKLGKAGNWPRNF